MLDMYFMTLLAPVRRVYAPRRASVVWVSLPGIHISLAICERGYTYHGDTHITGIHISL